MDINHNKILKEIRILKAQNEAMTNALMVLEKELSGSGMPEGSILNRREKIRLDAIKKAARNKTLQIKKASQR